MRPVFKNILVPIDFSAVGNTLINIAAEICKEHNGVLHLIHVKESRYILNNPESEPAVSAIIKDIDLEARDRLNELYEFALKEHNIPVQIYLAKGIPFDEICKAALEITIDLIVIGKCGTSGSKSNILGSTAYNVIKYAIVPVLSIPFNFHHKGFKNILIPLRYSQSIREKYGLLKQLLNSQVNNVHIGIFSLPKEEEKASQYNDYLHDVVLDLDEKCINCTTELFLCKNIAAKVLEIAIVQQSDLVIINTALDYKLTQFCMSDYTRQIINYATLPVLAVRNCAEFAGESKSETEVAELMLT